MQWYVGGEKLPPRPKASYADLVHLVTDWGHNIRQTEHLARVNENTSNIANSVNTLLEVNSFNLAVNSQSLANQEQIFQETKEREERRLRGIESRRQEQEKEERMPLKTFFYLMTY